MTTVHTDLVVPRPTFAPPLDIARAQARWVLDQANALETVNGFVLVAAFGDVCEALRQVLAALDAEDGHRA